MFNSQSYGRQSYWRSNSIDILPYCDTEPEAGRLPESHRSAACQEEKLYWTDKVQLYAQVGRGQSEPVCGPGGPDGPGQPRQVHPLSGYSVHPMPQKPPLLRSDAFSTATQFTDQQFHSGGLESSFQPAQPAVERPAGEPKPARDERGSNEDMKKVLMELGNIEISH